MNRILAVVFVSACVCALATAQTQSSTDQGGMFGGMFGGNFPFSQPTARQLTTFGLLDSEMGRMMFPFFPKELYCTVCMSAGDFLCMRQHCN